jgi:hypothetical protein
MWKVCVLRTILFIRKQIFVRMLASISVRSTEGDLDATVFNQVASTIQKWRTFKLSRWSKASSIRNLWKLTKINQVKLNKLRKMK